MQGGYYPQRLLQLQIVGCTTCFIISSTAQWQLLQSHWIPLEFSIQRSYVHNIGAKLQWKQGRKFSFGSTKQNNLELYQVIYSIYIYYSIIIYNAIPSSCLCPPPSQLWGCCASSQVASTKDGQRLLQKAAKWVPSTSSRRCHEWRTGGRDKGGEQPRAELGTATWIYLGLGWSWWKVGWVK